MGKSYILIVSSDIGDVHLLLKYSTPFHNEVLILLKYSMNKVDLR